MGYIIIKLELSLGLKPTIKSNGYVLKVKY